MEQEPTLSGSRSNQELTEQQRYWLDHYLASQASGNSMAEYARKHGLAIKSFYYWKKRLLQLGAIEPPPMALEQAPVFHTSPGQIREWYGLLTQNNEKGGQFKWPLTTPMIRAILMQKIQLEIGINRFVFIIV